MNHPARNHTKFQACAPQLSDSRQECGGLTDTANPPHWPDSLLRRRFLVSILGAKLTPQAPMITKAISALVPSIMAIAATSVKLQGGAKRKSLRFHQTCGGIDS
jgi:hypothetical protein